MCVLKTSRHTHRERDKERETPTRTDMRTTPVLREAAEPPTSYFSFLWNSPHTITYILVGFAFLIYFVFFRSHDDPAQNARLGLAAVCLAFMLYCALHVRSVEKAMVRPHPVFWRLTLSCGVLYLLALVFFMFQTLGDARRYLSLIYPDLNQPLAEKEYASDCRVYTPEKESKFQNVMDTIHDEFVLAHIIGHFFKALLWRDWKLAWVLSLFFEITEVTFQHMMENFLECWWDHLVLDVLVCNFAGMYMGMKFVEYFEMREYNWVGEKVHLDKYEWDILSSAKRFTYVFIIAFVTNCAELYGFFLKYILWVPPKNPMNTIRLVIWMGIGVPALREFYQYITDKKTKRIGVNSWIGTGLFFAETIIIIKFGMYGGDATLFNNPMPPNILYPWLAVLVLLACWFILYFRSGPKSDILVWVLRSMVTVIVALQIFIFVSGCPDLEFGKEWFDGLFSSPLPPATAATAAV